MSQTFVSIVFDFVSAYVIRVYHLPVNPIFLFCFITYGTVIFSILVLSVDLEENVAVR